MSGGAFAERNGWRLFRHAEFRRSVDALAAEVERLARQQPDDWRSHPKAKLLRRIVDLIEVEIPRDPNAPEFAQGNTLGPTHRHWRRAKFLGRFRLFFRFDSASRIIVYAWVNDENTLRKAGSRTDPYAVFRRRLEDGNPPDDWNVLLAEAQCAEATRPSVRPLSRRGTMPDRFVYKIMSAEELRRMQHDGVFRGSPADIADGFIHLSCGPQLAGTLDRHFSGVDSLMLATVDLSRLGDTVRWEPSRGGQLFPHIYGPLPIQAVVSTAPVARTADGAVRLPGIA